MASGVGSCRPSGFGAGAGATVDVGGCSGGCGVETNALEVIGEVIYPWWFHCWRENGERRREGDEEVREEICCF